MDEREKQNIVGGHEMVQMPTTVSDKLASYRECIGKGMKGKKFNTKEGRYLHFCTLTQICSGKAKDEEEGVKRCLEKHPDWEGI